MFYDKYGLHYYDKSWYKEARFHHEQLAGHRGGAKPLSSEGLKLSRVNTSAVIRQQFAGISYLN